jgi:hypothetical protein
MDQILLSILLQQQQVVDLVDITQLDQHLTAVLVDQAEVAAQMLHLPAAVVQAVKDMQAVLAVQAATLLLAVEVVLVLLVIMVMIRLVLVLLLAATAVRGYHHLLLVLQPLMLVVAVVVQGILLVVAHLEVLVDPAVVEMDLGLAMVLLEQQTQAVAVAVQEELTQQAQAAQAS